jgi:hypothetical protein
MEKSLGAFLNRGEEQASGINLEAPNKFFDRD